VSCTAVIGPVVVDTRAGTLQFTAATAAVGELAGAVTVSVARVDGSVGAASVNYATANGTAIAGLDYTATSGTLNWADGNADNKTVVIAILNRAGAQGSRSFTVRLSNPTAATLGSPRTNTVTINDAGVLKFTAAATNVTDGMRSLTMTVTRTSGTAGPASVKYATANGTAVAGTDYTATSGTLNWADGNANSQTFQVPIMSRAGVQGSRDFQVKLSAAVGASVAAPGTSTVTIVDAGAPPAAPIGVSASDGAFNDRVRVTWTAAAAATGYQVRRNTSNNPGGATQVGAPAVTTYDDTTAKPGVTYYYWVRAVNEYGTSADSAGDSGYAALPGCVINDYDGNGISELAVYDNNIGSWYAYSLQTGQATVWGRSWGWPGAETVPGDYDGDAFSDMAVYDQNTGYWYVWSEVKGRALLWERPWGWPGAETVYGDYDGDAKSDLAVYDQPSGFWYIITMDDRVLAWDRPWGWTGAITVPGDYDGDGLNDLCVYDQNTGYWYVQTLADPSSSLAWAQPWGWPGATTVPGDYDGDEKDDMAVYDQPSGSWYVWSQAKQKALIWARPWGWTGAVPVPGDYDGDGNADLAVFDTVTGYWYIWSEIKGKALAWAQPWGWPGANPPGGRK